MENSKLTSESNQSESLFSKDPQQQDETPVLPAHPYIGTQYIYGISHLAAPGSHFHVQYYGIPKEDLVQLAIEMRRVDLEAQEKQAAQQGAAQQQQQGAAQQQPEALWEQRRSEMSYEDILQWIPSDYTEEQKEFFTLPPLSDFVAYVGNASFMFPFLDRLQAARTTHCLNSILDDMYLRFKDKELNYQTLLTNRNFLELVLRCTSLQLKKELLLSIEKKNDALRAMRRHVQETLVNPEVAPTQGGRNAKSK